MTQRPTIWKTWRSLIKDLLLLAFIIFAARSAIADWNYVPTGSMKPTILEGDVIFINKLSYDLKIPFTTLPIVQWGNPQIGDVVVFNAPKDGIRMVKRVIGTPGDVIEMRNNHLFINNKMVKYSELDENLIRVLPEKDQRMTEFALEHLGNQKHAVMEKPFEPAMRSFGPLGVPAGKYLVLGDNRDNSGDSRYFGFVERSQIVGQVLGVVASWDKFHYYLPRINRFFTALQ